MAIGFIARSLISSIFVTGGVAAVKEPGGRTELVQKAFSKVGVELAEPEAETLVKVNGAVMVGAGATFALGLFKKTSALALIGALVPTTVAGHPFWEETSPQARAGQQVQFLKNAAIVGGLIAACVGAEKAKSAKKSRG